MQKLDMLTPDVIQANIETLSKLFPNIITETENADGTITKAIDYDLFRQMFASSLVEGGEERYRLDWPGKRASILKANTPISKTLRPVVADSVNWDTTENLYIEGDNFEVLKVLQESYLGKVKMIYIDPPYNTGKDFVYTDNFKVSREEYEEGLEIVDEGGGRLVKNTDTNGRFHSDWLSMMYERLILARDLLTDDGVIFMSIDDNEVHNLRKIADDIFGEENFVSELVWQKKYTGGKHASFYVDLHEYVLVFGKNKSQMKPILMDRPNEEKDKFIYEDTYFKSRGKYYIRPLKSNLDERKTLIYPIQLPDGKSITTQWLVSEDTFLKMQDEGRIDIRLKQNGEYQVYKKYYENDGEGKVMLPSLIHGIYNTEAKIELKEIFGNQEGRDAYFDTPKPINLLKYLTKPILEANDIIIDFYSGSSSTAHAVMQLNAEDGGNRRFIMIQIPEETDKESEAYKAGYQNICEIGKERIRRAGKKIVEENKDKEGIENLDVGFRVYRLDTSNMKDVYYHPTEVSQDRLFEIESNIREDRTPEDILAQVMLDLGLTLDLPIEKRAIHGSTVYYVAENSLVACFDEHVDFSLVDEIASVKPLRVVFRDSSFSTDADRINFETRFAKLSPETDIRVI